MTNSATNGCDETDEATRTTCAADPFRLASSGVDCTSDIYKQLRINECIAVAFGMTADPVNAFGSDDDRCPALVTEHCTANPFANNVHCMPGTYDGDRLKFAKDCYNPANRDTEECNNIKGCLNHCLGLVFGFGTIWRYSL